MKTILKTFVFGFIIMPMLFVCFVFYIATNEPIKIIRNFKKKIDANDKIAKFEKVREALFDRLYYDVF